MAKKKSRKKHQFKHVSSPNAIHAVKPESSSAVELTQASAPASIKASAKANSVEAEFGPGLSFIKADLGKVGLLALSLLCLELVLWFLFNHTGLGPSVYNLIKL